MKISPLLAFTILPFLFSCQSSLINLDINSKYNQNYGNILPIKGNVNFPNLSKFNIKASTSDISSDSTVSLIYPSNHVENANKTISTGLTDKNGSFLINPNFKPIVNEILVLEASKRLGTYGSFLMSLRTLVKWNGSTWSSITGESIYINNKTTALTGIISLLSPSVNYENAINSFINLQPTDIKNKQNGSIVIKSSSIISVSELVDFALSKNQDPISYLIHENNSFKLREPNSITRTISTVAGGFSNNIINVNDSFIYRNDPVEDIVLDDEGNLFFAEYNRIRKVNQQNNTISTIVGTGDSSYTLNSNIAINSKISSPSNLRLGDDKNLYFLDTVGLRKVDLKTGILSTIIKNKSIDNIYGNSESFISNKIDIKEFEIKDNNIYINDYTSIKKIDLKKGSLDNISEISNYNLLTIDKDDNIYGFFNRSIVKISKSGVVTTIYNKLEEYSYPNMNNILKLSPNNNELYFRDYNKLKKINLKTSEMSIVAGMNSDKTGETINGLEFDLDGNIYFIEYNKLKKIDKDTGVISAINEDVIYSESKGKNLMNIVFKNNKLYYSTYMKIKTIDIKSNFNTTLVGSNSFSHKDGLKSVDLPIFSPFITFSLDRLDNIYFFNAPSGQIKKIDSKTNIVSTFAGLESNNLNKNTIANITDGNLATLYNLSGISSISFDKEGNMIFYDGIKIRKINIKTGILTTIYERDSLKHNGNSPKMALDSQDNIYFFDMPYIKKLDIKSGLVSNLFELKDNYYNKGIPIEGVSNNSPVVEIDVMTFDNFDNLFFSQNVGGQAKGGIKKFDKTTGVVSEVLGNSYFSSFGTSYGGNGEAKNTLIPRSYGIVFDKENNMYFSDSGSNKIRKLDMLTDTISVIAGNGEVGYYQNGDGGDPRLAKMSPKSLALDSKGNLYFNDESSIRKIEFLKSVQ